MTAVPIFAVVSDRQIAYLRNEWNKRTGLPVSDVGHFFRSTH